MSQLLATGIMAPDFRLRVTPDQDLSLSELRGQRVILSFYPADWSPVCGDQITLYNQVRPEFQNYSAEILGISVDGAWCHQAYAKHNQFTSRCSPTFIQKVLLRRSTARIASRMGCANAPSS